MRDEDGLFAETRIVSLRRLLRNTLRKVTFVIFR
jgi:hypothetical protein